MADTAVLMLKQMETFQPSARYTRDECERHYMEVHRHWAVEALAASETLLQYHTTALEAQWDITGRFRRSPDLWRYAALQFRPPGEEFPPALVEMLAHDHQYFLRDLRSFDVEEEIVLDITSGQLTSSKYLVLVDRPDGTAKDEAVSAAEALAAGLTRSMEAAYGARRMVLNRVLRENGTAEMQEPGQRLTGEVLDSDRLLMLEMYFDDARWGDEFFGGEDILEMVRASVFAPTAVSIYRGTEQTGHDRR